MLSRTAISNKSLADERPFSLNTAFCCWISISFLISSPLAVAVFKNSPTASIGEVIGESGSTPVLRFEFTFRHTLHSLLLSTHLESRIVLDEAYAPCTCTDSERLMGMGIRSSSSSSSSTSIPPISCFFTKLLN